VRVTQQRPQLPDDIVALVAVAHDPYTKLSSPLIRLPEENFSKGAARAFGPSRFLPSKQEAARSRPPALSGLRVGRGARVGSLGGST
jgi:hypothetical protein